MLQFAGAVQIAWGAGQILRPLGTIVMGIYVLAIGILEERDGAR